VSDVPTIDVQLEPEDYVKASLAVSELSRKGILQLTALMVGVAVVAVFVAVYLGDVSSAILIGASSAGAAGGVLIAKRLTLPRKTRRIFAQTPSLQRPFQITWDERTLSSSSQQGAVSYPWAEFHKTRELAGYFLVFLSEVMFIIIPKRAFPDEATLRNFRECLRTHVQPRHHAGFE
jgi:YcxB-like protein